jgi:Ca-activated chloride channel homolog
MTSALPIFDCQPASEPSGFGCLRSATGALPLAEFTADLHVAGPVWRWSLRQIFVNNGRQAIEAVYIFPLPPRGAVSAFRLRVAGRLVEGDLQERGQARANYQAAVTAGKRAALLEEDRPDVFTIQVGNIQAGESAEVELEISGPVAVEDGIASVRLPLVVAPRYIPGSALGDDVGDGTASDTDAVPDASRISPPVLLPGFPSPVRLAITLTVAGVDEQVLSCTLQTVAEGFGRWRVLPGQRLNRDCVVRWPARAAELAATGLIAEARDGGCTLAVTVCPPAGVAVAQRPRDVVVLLDRSGSMAGWKMVAARRAAARLVDALDAHDRFAALAFDDKVEGLDARVLALHAATDRARFAAVSWLGGIDSRGGTELNSALDSAFGLLAHRDDGRERILVLITDAQIGDEDRLLKRHAAALARTRVVALGIDKAVNEGLLSRLVAPNGGWHACVESEDWLDQVLAVAARAVQPPVLADVSIEADGEVLPACTPDPVPDAWASRPLTVFARLPSRPGRVTVRGLQRDGSTWSRDIVVQTVVEPALHATWARGRIRDLEDRHAATRSGELVSEIVRLSLSERVLCRFTAFVAVDHEITAGGVARRMVQAVETPAGWEKPHEREAVTRGGSALGKAGAATGAASPLIPEYLASRISSSSVTWDKDAAAPRKSRRMAVPVSQREEHKVAAPVDVAALARALLARLESIASDRMRLALALRAGNTTSDLAILANALRAAAPSLADRLADLLRRLQPPATITAVAACWDDVRALLAEVGALPPRTAEAPVKRRGLRFWG